jgi:hypothetical protein
MIYIYTTMIMYNLISKIVCDWIRKIIMRMEMMAISNLEDRAVARYLGNATAY